MTEHFNNIEEFVTFANNLRKKNKQRWVGFEAIIGNNLVVNYKAYNLWVQILNVASANGNLRLGESVPYSNVNVFNTHLTSNLNYAMNNL